MFNRRRLAPNTKEIVKEMFRRIEKSFVDNLQNVDWIDEKTRENMISKVGKIDSLIAYPNLILDPVKLEEYYKDLVIDDSDYYGNRVRLSQFHQRLSVLVKGKIEDKIREWGDATHLFLANSSYLGLFNKILIQLGILQRPLFDLSFPSSMNYGAIGFVMGHEVLHGFDDHSKMKDMSDEPIFLLSFWVTILF